MNHSIRRRDLLVGGISLLVPFGSAFAQSGTHVYRLGMVAGNPPGPHPVLEHLARLGYLEGRNLEIRRVPPLLGDVDKVNASVRELVAWNPDVILTSTTYNTRLVQRATGTIPIVFINVADPVSAGFVKSLSDPGGNITGVSMHNLTLWPKRLELIRELLPDARRVVLIMDGSFARDGYPADFQREMRETAQRLGLELIEADVAQSPTGFDAAFREHVASLRPDIAMLIGPWPSLRKANAGWERALQNDHHVPVLGFFPWKGSSQEDLLVQLGAPPGEMWEIGAAKIASIFGGAKVAGIPVHQSTKVELVVNLKAARALGITVPKGILLRADRVIE